MLVFLGNWALVAGWDLCDYPQMEMLFSPDLSWAEPVGIALVVAIAFAARHALKLFWPR